MGAPLPLVTPDAGPIPADKAGRNSRHLDFVRTSTEEGRLVDFEFRSGYFYRLSKMAGQRVLADGRKVDIPDSTPLHTEYLLHAVAEGHLDQATLDSVLPPA